MKNCKKVSETMTVAKSIIILAVKKDSSYVRRTKSRFFSLSFLNINCKKFSETMNMANSSVLINSDGFKPIAIDGENDFLFLPSFVSSQMMIYKNSVTHWLWRIRQHWSIAMGLNPSLLMKKQIQIIAFVWVFTNENYKF